MRGQAGDAGAPLREGDVLQNGRFVVHRRLNKGATAVVYAALDRQTGQRVALKVVQCGPEGVPVHVVKREVSLSSQVAHENIVQMLDVFALNDKLMVIVWELISGPDLLDLLNECNCRMSEPEAAFYFVQLLRAVLQLHSHGFCHRDLKAENCMIERSTQRLKLIDFGLSKHLQSVATLAIGTLDYMAPEMVRQQTRRQGALPLGRAAAAAAPAGAAVGGGSPGGDPGGVPYDAKAVDAWAMGVLLSLLVTGTYPFEDPAQPNNLAATILNVQAGRRRPLPPHISAGCRTVIAGLLTPDPAARTRLPDLAHDAWLLQSAAAHVARLPPALRQSFAGAGSPEWVVPLHFADAQAPALQAGSAAGGPGGRSSSGGDGGGGGAPVAMLVEGGGAELEPAGGPGSGIRHGAAILRAATAAATVAGGGGGSGLGAPPRLFSPGGEQQMGGAAVQSGPSASKPTLFWLPNFMRRRL